MIRPKFNKTETVEEFIKRGGQIKVVPKIVSESQVSQAIGFSRKYSGIPDKNDRDGLIPNLKWMGGDNRRWW